MKHVVVYRDSRRYAGWPANYGMWAWGDEIVLCFTSGYPAPSDGLHTRDKTRPFVTMQAHSTDGGETWEVGKFPGRTPGGRALSADEHQVPELQVGGILDEPGALADPPGELDFTAPDLAVMCARSGLGGGARAWFYATLDRCRSWAGPYALPDFGQPGIAARTDYVAVGPKSALFWLTAAKRDGREGRVFCVRTDDGGASFRFVAWLDEEPMGFAIMPASVRLGDGQLRTAVRRSEGTGAERHSWIDMYGSDDAGATWRALSRPVDDAGRGGNPPTLTTLPDGRLVLTYGYRAEPFGIRARVSADNGATWGPPVVLRDDGGGPDLGYPRTVRRADGRLVTAYYFNDEPTGERYIAATIWRP